MKKTKKYSKAINRILDNSLNKFLEIIIGIIIAGISFSYFWLLDYLEQFVDTWVAHFSLISSLVILGNIFCLHFLKKKKNRLIVILLGVVLVLVLLTVIIMNLWVRNTPQDKFVVLVTTLDNVPNNNFKLQKTITSELQKKYHDEIQTISLTKAIKTSDEAKKEGKKKRADIVLWGDYNVPEGISEEAEINIEILTNATASAKLSPLAKGEPISHPVKEDHKLVIRANITKNVEYVSLFVLGLAKYQKQDWTNAEKYFLKALDALPDQSPFIDQSNIYRYIGFIRYKKADYLQAIDYFTKAIELDPKEPIFWYNRGVSYYESNQLEKAKSDYTQLITIDESYADAYLNRGVVLNTQGYYKEAIDDFTKATELNPKDDLAYYNKGNSYKHLNKFDDAILAYTKAISLNPTRPNNYSARAVSYHKKGEADLAIKDYTEALKHNPTKEFQATIYYLRGTIYYQQNKIDLAFSDYETILKVTPKDAAYFRVVGGLYVLQANQEKDDKKKDAYQKKAFDYTEKAIKLNKNDPQNYVQRGNFYLVKKEFQKGCADFHTALQLNEQTADAYVGRAFCAYFINKDKQSALADYKTAINLYDERLAQTKDQETKDAIEILKLGAEKFSTTINNASTTKN